MKKLKKWFGAALALGLALAVSVVPVGVAVAAETAKLSPSQGGQWGGIHENLEFYGTVPCRITSSTTAVLCRSGEGLLDAVCANGASPIAGTAYSLGLDSGIAGTRSVTNSDSLVLTPMVFALADTTSSQGQMKCWSARDASGGPVRFVKGLVGVQSAAAHQTVLYWHYSDGTNP